MSTRICAKRVFIKRNPPYDPQANNGIVPSDYQYTAPVEVCDEHTEGSFIEDWLRDWFNIPGHEENEHERNKEEDNLDNGFNDNTEENENNTNGNNRNNRDNNNGRGIGNGNNGD